MLVWQENTRQRKYPPCTDKNIRHALVLLQVWSGVLDRLLYRKNVPVCQPFRV